VDTVGADYITLLPLVYPPNAFSGLSAPGRDDEPCEWPAYILRLQFCKRTAKGRETIPGGRLEVAGLRSLRGRREGDLTWLKDLRKGSSVSLGGHIFGTSAEVIRHPGKGAVVHFTITLSPLDIDKD
jgi:hypothetical protein